jgi:hypothetical protein
MQGRHRGLRAEGRNTRSAGAVLLTESLPLRGGNRYRESQFGPARAGLILAGFAALGLRGFACPEPGNI